KVKQVLWIILFANFAVALLKIIIGNQIKSYSMTADGFHSLSEISSNITLFPIFFVTFLISIIIYHPLFRTSNLRQYYKLFL
ncbi:cation transporter, partial [Clostridioides difficile]|uniref:cation transporter n=1 Tax=Clostridioides difficile TaxID=1496 RepID=UPI002ED3C6D2